MLRAATLACGEDSKAHYNVGMYYLKEPPGRSLLHFKKAVALDDQWYAAHLAWRAWPWERSEYDAALVSLKIAVNLRRMIQCLWSLIQVYDRSLGIGGTGHPALRVVPGAFPGGVCARATRASGWKRSGNPTPCEF